MSSKTENPSLVIDIKSVLRTSFKHTFIESNILFLCRQHASNLIHPFLQHHAVISRTVEGILELITAFQLLSTLFLFPAIST